MERPPGIYASSLSRRDLAWRWARLRSSWLTRAGHWAAVVALLALAAVLAQRLIA